MWQGRLVYTHHAREAGGVVGGRDGARRKEMGVCGGKQGLFDGYIALFGSALFVQYGSYGTLIET